MLHSQRWLKPKSAPVCRSIHVYKAARRVKEIDVSKAPNAYLWEPDPNGKDRVMVDDGRSIQQENGTWFKVQGTKIILERYDRRRTARPNPAWAFLDRRNRRIG